MYRQLSLVIQETGIEDNNFSEFIKDNFIMRSSNLKNIRKSNLKCSFIVKNFTICSEAKYCIDKAGLLLDNYTFYKRMQFNNLVYTCAENKTKFNNSIIKHNNEIGQIEYIMYSEEEREEGPERSVLLLCRKITTCTQPFFCEQYSNIKSHYVISCLSRSFFIVPHNEFIQLKKLCMCDYKDRFCFVTTFCSSHLFS